MRTFIAIEIPDEVKKEMAELQRQLKSSAADASWPRSEGIHLTLKFLGEIPEAKVSEVQAALASAASGSGPFRLEVERVGTFPNPKNARVVWIGLSGDIEKLTALQTAIEDGMAGLGMKREDRPFTPHLTLGRIKYIRSRDTWLKALDSVKDVRLPGFDVKGVSLMKSELKRTGAVYTEVAKIELQENRREE